MLQTRSERFTGDAKAQDCTPTNRDERGHSLSAWRPHHHANAEGCLGIFAVLVNPSLPVEVVSKIFVEEVEHDDDVPKLDGTNCSLNTQL